VPSEAAGLMTIGALARASGVPVKTIRHYSDLGLLPPADVTSARYRLYRPAALGDLETIRLFRSLDFSLEAIAAIVDRKRPLRESVQLQLDAVDTALRRLRRTRAVLQRALESASDENLPAIVSRLQSIARLDAGERSAIMREAIESHLRGGPVDEAWRLQLWDAAFKNLPDELSDAQWDALFDLMELVHDPSFGASVAAQGRRHWRRMSQADAARSQREMARLIALAVRAHDTGEDFESPRAKRLVATYVRWSARRAGRQPSPAFARALIREAASHDPREERFWELVGVLRGWPPGPLPQTRAFRWLLQALARQFAMRPTRVGYAGGHRSTKSRAC
jgi:DNA-binding transcriptional MerR regulator